MAKLEHDGITVEAGGNRIRTDDYAVVRVDTGARPFARVWLNGRLIHNDLPGSTWRVLIREQIPDDQRHGDLAGTMDGVIVESFDQAHRVWFLLHRYGRTGVTATIQEQDGADWVDLDPRTGRPLEPITPGAG